MTRHRLNRACRAHGCTTRTSSVTGRCERHRRPVTVRLSPAGAVHIGGHLTMSTTAALELADRIVDTIEAGR